MQPVLCCALHLDFGLFDCHFSSVFVWWCSEIFAHVKLCALAQQRLGNTGIDAFLGIRLMKLLKEKKKKKKSNMAGAAQK